MKTSTTTGRRAEQAATEFLKQRGFKIREQNWKTSLCEIDIVAEKDGCVYFVEVKYRSSNRQGGGLEYITRQKQNHMRRAAEIWIGKNHWPGEVTLSAVAVSTNFTVTDFVESIEF